MEILKFLLKKLSGKKTMLCGSIGLTIAYLAAKNILGEVEVIFLGGLNLLFFGGASYATGKIVYNK